MSIQTNIERGAVTTESGIIVGGLAEYCNTCGAFKSTDGCSNTDCIESRPVNVLQKRFQDIAIRRLLGCLI